MQDCAERERNRILASAEVHSSEPVSTFEDGLPREVGVEMQFLHETEILTLSMTELSCLSNASVLMAKVALLCDTW